MRSTIDQLSAAAEHGRICALAGEAQRDLTRCAQAYPDLFAGDPFDPALLCTVALANTFSAPWLPAHKLRMANRASLWIFAVDLLIDYRARSRDDVRDAVCRCLDVVEGRTADDPLTRFLADLVVDLSSAPAYPVLGSVWRDELRRMLEAMAREWDWKVALARGGANGPSIADYLDNADNSGFCFVFTSHWVYTDDPESCEHADEVRHAARQVQRVLRLINDLGTYHRDVSWGDLNALMLGMSEADVTRQIAEQIDDCRDVLDALSSRTPRLASFLERQLGFNAGFYRISDYWGSL